MPILSDDEGQPMGLAPQLAEPMQITPPTPPFSKLFEAALPTENWLKSLKEDVEAPRMSPPARDLLLRRLPLDQLQSIDRIRDQWRFGLSQLLYGFWRNAAARLPPLAAKARTVASPMPRDPPVTNTVLPLRPIMPFLSIELTKSRPLLIGISRGERQH